jgi:hypothetical protein
MPARFWTDEEVGNLLYLATYLPKSDPRAAGFWQAAEAFGYTENPIDRKRVQREAAKLSLLVERLDAAEILRLRRQLEGLGEI